MSPKKSEVESWWQQLERLAVVLGRVGPDEMCCENLTQRQCAILRTLAKQEGARLKDLAKSLDITPSALTRVIQRLESRSLVQRVRGEQKDGRAAGVRITPAGRKTRKLLDKLMRERTAQIMASVSSDHRAEILAALDELNASIENIDFCGLNAPVKRLR